MDNGIYSYSSVKLLAGLGCEGLTLLLCLLFSARNITLDLRGELGGVGCIVRQSGSKRRPGKSSSTLTFEFLLRNLGITTSGIQVVAGAASDSQPSNRKSSSRHDGGWSGGEVVEERRMSGAEFLNDFKFAEGVLNARCH
jgi:hypothetical protein